MAALGGDITTSIVAPTPSPYVVSPEAVVAALRAEEAWLGLEEQEQAYALHLARACWAGWPINAAQTSPESPTLLALIHRMFRRGVEAVASAAVAAGVSPSDWTAALTWFATVVDNGGNYRSFGDTKLVPAVAPATLTTIVVAAAGLEAEGGDRDGVVSMWRGVAAAVYDLSPSSLQLGMAPEGVTTYYSPGFTKEEADLISRFTTSLGLTQLYNSRVWKVGPTTYQIRLASADPAATAAGMKMGTHTFESATISIVGGDHAKHMAGVVRHLEAAAKVASNPTQAAMLRDYASAFTTGDMYAHIEGSRKWVKDVGPTVENYIGFIESYRDPMGVRGEWEGFVAVVNKEVSRKFGTLVAGAGAFLAKLPWGSVFEKDEFITPDFTSLDVLAFASSGIPAGINIPNYVETRHEGFKNVSLGNVLSARDVKGPVTFLGPEDGELYRRWLSPAFEVQVGLHELLGHGSGKLLMEKEGGDKNFDPATTVDPFTHAPITSWYKPGQSWDTVFGPYASTMEECRAEAVGIYLCTDPAVLSIFGHGDGGEGGDVVYINWLNMARAGLLALQFYTPASSPGGTGIWGQAHMTARHALLRVMLQAGEGFVTLVGAPGADMTIRMDRSKIMSVGVPAIASFLTRLQVYKSTAAAVEGRKWYDSFTTIPPAGTPIPDGDVDWLAVRDTVIAQRKPRQMFVQPVLESVVEGGAVAAGVDPAVLARSTVVGCGATARMRTFPADAAGLLESFVTRVAVEGLVWE